MKKKLNLLSLVVIVGLLSAGCATSIPAGAFYTEVSFPGGVGSGDMSYSKVGKATTTSYFGLIATGDASISEAAKNGKIQKIKFVDYKVKNMLGFIGEYTTYVYGD